MKNSHGNRSAPGDGPTTSPAKKAKTIPFDLEKINGGFETYPHFSTDVMHTGYNPDDYPGAPVIPPIIVSTTYKQSAPGKSKGYDYTRGGNPTRTMLEAVLAKTEDCKHATVFSSGCACLDTVIHLLNTGDHMICNDDVYGGTNRYVHKVGTKHGIEFDFINAADVKAIVKALRPTTKLVWIETPTNPMMTIVDLEAVITAVRANASKDVLIAVDNTFQSPYFQRPIDYGCDLVTHSMTKYLNGHTDVLMGVIMTNDTALDEKIKFTAKSVGNVPGPFDCFLALRGVKTLAVRMKQHMYNGLKVAAWLESHPRVKRVIHPGLKSHPQYELGLRQMKGYSGMLSFYVDGESRHADTLLSNIKVIQLAETLGGYESLANLPAKMTHGSVPPDQRRRLGITDTLVRLSIGIEEVDDIIADLDQAFKAAFPEDK